MISQSDTIAKLSAALVKAGGEFPTVEKNSTNPHFKAQYADLTAIVETVRPILAANGLAVAQFPDELDGEPALTTRLVHSSGEYVEATTPLALAPRGAKPNAQEVGSATTYARRYGLQAVLGLVAEDDDGNAASRPAASAPGGAAQSGGAVRTGGNSRPPAPDPSPPAAVITEAQRQRLWVVARANRVSEEMVKAVVLATTGQESTKAIPGDKYDAVIEALGAKAAA